jgi:hypothetical protein
MEKHMTIRQEKKAKMKALRAAARIARAKRLLNKESGWSNRASSRGKESATAAAKRARRITKLQKITGEK